ncbi:MAG TPA: type IV secretory system conjugative DNA transfer family protein [Acidimicrobiales bacterium]|nr:type IV secretory system conjugative DNA transfer family protein [Acidimicrobiales bacterium]
MESGRDHGGGADLVVAAGVLLVGGAGGALWVAGQLGGAAWTRRWPTVPLSSALVLAARVARHPARPDLAWPPAARSMLPPALVLYGLSAVLIALPVGAAVIVAGRLRAGPLGPVGSSARRQSGPLSARWALGRDLRLLRVRATTPGRLTIGRRPALFRRGELLAGEPRSSLIVLGPSQSGKTSGLAVPAILEWRGPVVATSVKNDLVQHTLGWRHKLGPTWVFDPTASTGLESAAWSPIASCDDWQRARQVANWLCAAARTRSGNIGDEDFWYGAASKLLAPHLFAAAHAGRTITDVVRWIDTQEEEEVGALLIEAGIAEAERAAAASWDRDERTRSSVYATAEMVLDAFADPTVARATRSSQIRIRDLLDGRFATLYLCAPTYEQTRLRPVFATLVHEVLNLAFERAGRQGRPLDPPLLLVLDEAANIAPVNDLDGLASTAAGHGVQLVTVFQDLAQIQARYGDRAGAVVNNHRGKLVLSGVSDGPTLELASRLAGESDTRDGSVTTDDRGRRSTTRASRERRLVTDAQVRLLQPHEAILIYGHLQPARIRLRPWFRDPVLRRRAGTAPDPTPGQIAVN